MNNLFKIIPKIALASPGPVLFKHVKYLSNFNYVSREMKFLDHKRVQFTAGKGGNGISSFMSIAQQEFAGPDGGDGGNGGSIQLVGDLKTHDFSNIRTIMKAKDGTTGMGENLDGKAGPMVTIPVPPGTAIYDEDSNLIYEILLPGETFLAVQGGLGGRGNCHFKSASNRQPRQFTLGRIGEECTLTLELKSIADVGLVGFPNAGKSSFLNAVSKAHPKIASYPFTTLNPYIGSVDFSDFYRFTMADIPGIVKGASENLGRGHYFLRHIERCKVLIYILDMAGQDNRNPVEDFLNLREELGLYKKELKNTPGIVLANKMDLPEAQIHLERLRQEVDMPIVEISALKKENIFNATGVIRSLLEKEGITLHTQSKITGARQVKNEIDYSRF